MTQLWEKFVIAPLYTTIVDYSDAESMRHLIMRLLESDWLSWNSSEANRMLYTESPDLPPLSVPLASVRPIDLRVTPLKGLATLALTGYSGRKNTIQVFFIILDNVFHSVPRLEANPFMDQETRNGQYNELIPPALDPFIRR